MKLFLHKIRKYKRRYISLVLALVIVQGILLLSVNILINLKCQLFPETIFNIENTYQLEVLYPYPNTKPELVDIAFSQQLKETIEAIDGVRIHVASGIFPLTKGLQIHQSKNELDIDVKTFTAKAGPGFEELFPVNFLKGKGFCDVPTIKEVILTETLAKKLDVFNKKLPTLTSLPSRYSEEWQDFFLCGIIEDLGYFNEEKVDEAVYPIIYKAYSDFSLLKLDEDVSLFELKKKIKQAALPFTHGYEPIIQIIQLDSRVNDLWQEAKSMIIPVVSVIPIILLYVLIAMFGLFWTDMKRKKTDYGIMRAVGFSKWMIFRNLILEALLLVAFSGVISFLLTWNFSDVLKEFWKGSQGNLGIWLPWFISFMVILFLVIIASIIPAIRTIQIQPVEALSEE